MADKSKTLEIVVSLNDKFSRGLKLAQKRVNELKKAVFNLKTAFVGLGAGVGGAALGTSFIDAAQKAEQLRLRLDNLLNSAEEGAKVFANTTAYAKTVSHEFEHLMETATTLAGVMRGGSEEVAKWLPIIGDLAAVAGLTLQETTSNFVRMYSAGAAAADLFRERGILALLDFHAKTAYTVQETREKIVKAWEAVNSRFKDTASDLALTWKGLLSMLRDRWFLFRLDIMNNDVFAYMKASLRLVIDELDKLGKEGKLEQWAEDVADSIMINAKKASFALAGIADTTVGLVKAISGIWDLLPKEVKKYGIVGAVIGGKKGFLGGMAVGAVVDKYKQLAREAAIEIMLLAGDLDKASVAIYRSGERTEEAYDKLLGITPKKGGFFAEEGVLGFLHLPKEEQATKIVEKYWEKINKKVEDMRNAQAAKDKARTGKKLEPGGISAITASKLTLVELKAATQTALAELDYAYDEGMVSFDDYWNQRFEKLKIQYAKELEYLQKLAAAEAEPTLKATIETEIKVKQEQYAQADIAMLEQKKQAEQELFDKKLELQDVLAALDRENNEAGLSDMQLRFEQERALLESRQQEEYQLMMDYTSKLGDEIQKRKIMEDLARKQKGQLDKLEAEQDRKRRLDTIDTAKTVADGLNKIATGLYEAGGKQSKKMFALMKATAVVQATIKMHESIVGALGSPPYGWAAVANAAFVGAMGAAQIASIMGQEMASGGEVQGHSPHSRADNIPIAATAGEFMQPVSSVKYYGMEAMEAIRRKLIPRELFMGLGGLIPKMAYGSAADGGSIAGAMKNIPSQQQQSPKIEIINVTNPDAIRGLAMDTIHENRDMVVNMVLDGLAERNIDLQQAYS